MFDLVDHVPIKSSSAKILPIRQQALECLEARAAKLGYEVAGPFKFRVIELPLSMYLECRAPVRLAPVFGGGRRGR